MSTATQKHRAAFTLALRTVSPSLSALHASRLRLLPPAEGPRPAVHDCPHPPPLTPLTCVQCGHAFVRVRVARLGTETRKAKGKGKGKGTGKQKSPKMTSRNIHPDMARRRENLKRKVMDEYGAGREPFPLRVIERTCTTCAFVEHIPVPRGAAALFRSSSSVRKARRLASLTSRSGEMETEGTMSRAQDDASGDVASSLISSFSPATTPRLVTAPAGAHTHTHSPVHTPPVNPLPSILDPAPKKRLKKKPGLQELLERNRQRQDAAARAKASSGLSSFLDGL